MKFNSFQKLTVLIYVITIINIMLFMVPFKNYVGNESIISYDFIWSDRKHIDFFRFCIFLIIPTMIFFLLLKYYQKYNSLSDELYNKRLFFEKKIFIFYIISLSVVLSSLIILNLVNNNKMNQITLQKEKVEKRINDYNSKKETRMNFYNEMNMSFDLKQFKGSIPKFWERNLEIAEKANGKKISSILNEINKSSEFHFINRVDFKKFIKKNSYNSYDVETEKKIFSIHLEILNKNDEIKSLKSKIYSLNDILKTLLLSNLILVLLLFILRPTFLFVGSIFKETR